MGIGSSKHQAISSNSDDNTIIHHKKQQYTTATGTATSKSNRKSKRFSKRPLSSDSKTLNNSNSNNSTNSNNTDQSQEDHSKSNVTLEEDQQQQQLQQSHQSHHSSTPNGSIAKQSPLDVSGNQIIICDNCNHLIDQNQIHTKQTDHSDDILPSPPIIMTPTNSNNTNTTTTPTSSHNHKRDIRIAENPNLSDSVNEQTLLEEEEESSSDQENHQQQQQEEDIDDDDVDNQLKENVNEVVLTPSNQNLKLNANSKHSRVPSNHLLSMSLPAIITPTLPQPIIQPAGSTTNNVNILHSSLGSTSDLFNKSLITSFLMSNNITNFNTGFGNNNNSTIYSNQQPLPQNQQQLQQPPPLKIQQQQQQSTQHPWQQTSNGSIFSASSPTSPRTNYKDFSYDTKDAFTINVSNSELNSIVSDSSNGSNIFQSVMSERNFISSSGQRTLNQSSSSKISSKSNNANHLNSSTTTSTNPGMGQSIDGNALGVDEANVDDGLLDNRSIGGDSISNFFNTKDINFLHSDQESLKEKSTTSSSSNGGGSIVSSLSISTRTRVGSIHSNRPRGKSISDSLFMSQNSRDFINDIQKALENEKIKRTRFKELKEILGDRNDIIEISDIQFIQKVGEGAFSEVWEGWWKGIHVAVKKLKVIGDEDQFRERFIREVQNLKNGNHQNIVMFMGAIYRPACIVTEFMSGGSLYNVLHNPNLPKTKYSFPLVLKMASDIALGLMHIHSINIVHRDLTSQNILLDDMGNLKISDFGLSREKPRDGSATMTNGGICNPRWRPPEITKNLGHYSEKVDVYCFSLVVWELLTSEIPFSELDGSQASAQVAYAGLRPPLPDTCDPDLKELLTQCWDTEPSKRPTFSYILNKLKDISWNNPIGFISEQQHLQQQQQQQLQLQNQVNSRDSSPSNDIITPKT